MESSIPFSEVLRLLELNGWQLYRIEPPYRIFVKGEELPILIPVEDKKVSRNYVDKIEKILGKKLGEE